MSVNDSKTNKANEEVIVSLLDYVDVLMESFPKGITQKQLAKLTSVTPSAVTKIKDKLFLLCDVEALAYESRLLLKPSLFVLETTLIELLEQRNYFRVVRLLTTRYGEQVITQSDIHGWICNRMPLYGLFFSKEESELGAKIVLRYLRSFREPPMDVDKADKAITFIRDLRFMGPEGEDFLFGVFLGNELRKKEFNWPIEMDSELSTFIAMRDKIFHIMKYLIGHFLEGLSVIKELEKEEEKSKYKEVYERTVDFYLRRSFSIITDSLKVSARKKNLSFPARYSKIRKNVAMNLLEKITENLRSRPKKCA